MDNNTKTYDIGFNPIYDFNKYDFFAFLTGSIFMGANNRIVDTGYYALREIYWDSDYWDGLETIRENIFGEDIPPKPDFKESNSKSIPIIPPSMLKAFKSGLKDTEVEDLYKCYDLRAITQNVFFYIGLFNNYFSLVLDKDIYYPLYPPRDKPDFEDDDFDWDDVEPDEKTEFEPKAHGWVKTEIKEKDLKNGKRGVYYVEHGGGGGGGGDVLLGNGYTTMWGQGGRYLVGSVGESSIRSDLVESVIDNPKHMETDKFLKSISPFGRVYVNGKLLSIHTLESFTFKVGDVVSFVGGRGYPAKILKDDGRNTNIIRPPRNGDIFTLKIPPSLADRELKLLYTNNAGKGSYNFSYNELEFPARQLCIGGSGAESMIIYDVDGGDVALVIGGGGGGSAIVNTMIKSTNGKPEKLDEDGDEEGKGKVEVDKDNNKIDIKDLESKGDGELDVKIPIKPKDPEICNPDKKDKIKTTVTVTDSVGNKKDKIKWVDRPRNLCVLDGGVGEVDLDFDLEEWVLEGLKDIEDIEIKIEDDDIEIVGKPDVTYDKDNKEDDIVTWDPPIIRMSIINLHDIIYVKQKKLKYLITDVVKLGSYIDCVWLYTLYNSYTEDEIDIDEFSLVDFIQVLDKFELYGILEKEDINIEDVFKVIDKYRKLSVKGRESNKTTSSSGVGDYLFIIEEEK